jgi:hypothetical protein
MTAEVFRFTFHRLPEWTIRTLVETVGPAVVRAARVLAVLCLWLAVVFGPIIAAPLLRAPLWGDAAAAAWLALAVTGSVWGLYRLKKRRASLDRAAA